MKFDIILVFQNAFLQKDNYYHLPLLSPVGIHTNVTIFKSSPSFNHSLSITLIICIVSISCCKSSPAWKKIQFEQNNLKYINLHNILLVYLP